MRKTKQSQSELDRLTTHISDCALYINPEKGQCDCHVSLCGAWAASRIKQLESSCDELNVLAGKLKAQLEAAIK